MEIELLFNPFFLLKSAFKQTIAGYFLRNTKEIFSKREFVVLPDKDILSLEISTPKKWKKNDFTVVLVHGLCGSHRSPIMIRTTRKLIENNIQVVRLNLRGCGSGRGLSQSTYHSGDGMDVYLAVKKLKEKNPFSPIILVGFSLGGNIILKMAGDFKKQAKKYVERIIACSPPIDVKSSVAYFERKENKLYQKHFEKFLKEDILFLKKNSKKFPDIFVPNDMTLSKFNEFFVVPFFGFENVEDYYKKSSSLYVLNDIKVDTKILFSKDDPLVCSNSIKGIILPENVKIYFTKNGGHLGYLGNLKDKRGFFWLDSLLLDWILNNEVKGENFK